MVAPINNNHVQIMSNMADIIRRGENPLNNISSALIDAVASRLDRDRVSDMRLPVPNAARRIMSVLGEVIGQGMMGGLSANDASTLLNYLNQNAEEVQLLASQAARGGAENPGGAIGGAIGGGAVAAGLIQILWGREVLNNANAPAVNHENNAPDDEALGGV